MKLQDNTILITGGTSGFGYLFAERLLALGNTVIVTGRNADRLRETKAKLPGLHTVQSDVSDPGTIAFELGFEHSQSFSKLFRQKTRQTPTEFRSSFN